MNFCIEKGEFCVVVGASGAAGVVETIVSVMLPRCFRRGKTTILNILGGMDTLTSGPVLLDGEDLKSIE